MLDSSPVALPRPLKRSASTASLPTPPRTLDKKKARSRSRHSVQDTDSESNYSQSDSDGEKEVDRVSFGRKKRRTAVVLKGHDEEEHENEFWTGRSTGKKQKNVSADTDADDSDASPALLQYLVKAPVSPPPSKRQTSAPEPPVTPQSASSSRVLTRAARRQLLLRDSPENPFLDNSPPSLASSPTPRTATQKGEKEFMTYVFRGMKAQFANPFYNLPPSAHQRSLLPVEHPDYEAEEACPPKLLFPSARRQRHRRHSPEVVNDREPQTPPKKLISKKDQNKKLEIERTDSLRAGAVAGGKGDPLRRAQGPVRPTRR